MTDHRAALRTLEQEAWRALSDDEVNRAAEALACERARRQWAHLLAPGPVPHVRAARVRFSVEVRLEHDREALARWDAEVDFWPSEFYPQPAVARRVDWVSHSAQPRHLDELTPGNTGNSAISRHVRVDGDPSDAEERILPEGAVMAQRMSDGRIMLGPFTGPAVCLTCGGARVIWPGTHQEGTVACPRCCP